jgi:hypothetical protein
MPKRGGGGPLPADVNSAFWYKKRAVQSVLQGKLDVQYLDNAYNFTEIAQQDEYMVDTKVNTDQDSKETSNSLTAREEMPTKALPTRPRASIWMPERTALPTLH